MVHVIGNKVMKIGVDSLGSELTSIQTLDGFEYLWPGSAESWMGRSPLLFPVIGGLPDDKLILDGNEYAMQSHGFARKMDWKLLEGGSDFLTFVLESGKETRRQYPFEFRFILRYRLKGFSLEVNYHIENLDENEMLFSVGGHPGFRCPLEEGLSFDDYHLRFDKPESTVRHMKEGNLLNGITEPFNLPDAKLALNHDLFKRGAIILRQFKSECLILESEKGSRSLRVDFSGFPDLGIWSFPAKPAPFICIEPWFGVDSTVGDDGDFRKKSGIVSLEPGGNFESLFVITVD